MLVCRIWYGATEGMASIWQTPKLAAWTAPDRVEQALKRAVWLNIVIHTDEGVERGEKEWISGR
jgi:hypothetical protein